MVARHAPPSLTSIETVDTGTSAAPPPNQSAKRSGSVHSLHTRSRGASNTRVIAIPSSAGSATLRPPLRRREAALQAVEAASPEATVLLEPVDRLLERRPAQPRRPKLGRTAARD